MQGAELNAFLDNFPNLKKHYLGIFAINTLPKTIKFRQFLICNTDQSSGPGVHWFAFIRNSKSTIECFDSLGINSVKKQNLENYCKFRSVSELEFNESVFQSVNSNSCGFFTLYFIIQRMHNLDLSLKELLEEIFDDKDYEINEKIVLDFCSNISENKS